MAKLLTRRQFLTGGTLAFGLASIGAFWDELRSYIGPQLLGRPNLDRPLPEPLRNKQNYTKYAQNIALIEMTAPFTRPQYGQGVFISENYILTAAHIAEFYSKNKTVKVKHYKDIGKPVQTAIALKTYVHYDYSNSSQATETDLGLIELYIAEKKNRISLIPTPSNLHDLLLLAFWGKGWFSLRRFTEQYISLGIRLENRQSNNNLISGQHDAPTQGKWSGAPVLSSQENDLKLFGIHSAYIPDISNTFCGLDQDICDDLNQTIQTNNVNTIRWRKIWQDEDLVS